MADPRSITEMVASLSGRGELSSGTEKKLPKAPVATAIPARTGASPPKVQEKRAATGGIAGPLAEQAYADRQFWSSRVMSTPDGMFTMAVRPLKELKLRDANGDTVVLTFKDPPTS